jgi:small subunit ribosomal protein S4
LKVKSGKTFNDFTLSTFYFTLSPMVGPKEKHERALGTRLGLKGDRALSPKSSMIRKPYRPGVHGPKSRPRALSEFGLQSREKSKFKISYGVDDRNLRRLFRIASGAKGANGAKIMELLERRLDNVVFRLGFTPSRGGARQLVSHGHIIVNGKKVTSPGYSVRVGDAVGVRAASAPKFAFTSRREIMEKFDAPPWLHLDAKKAEGRVLSLPVDTESPFEINLLVEAFNK